MHPWSDTPDIRNESAYAVGDDVYSGGCHGTVVSVDTEHDTMGVIWDDGNGSPIVYPLDAPYLRGKFPWER